MSHKKKILLISFLCIAVLTTAIILAFTVFGLKNIRLQFKNTTTLYESEIGQAEVVESGKFKKNSCVFFINKQKYIDTLEKENPYLKVINIETKFPNTFIIHCVEREEFFVIKISAEKYFICDNEFKLLRIVEEYNPETNKCIILTGEINISNNDAEVGEYLSFGDEQEFLKNIPIALFMNNRTNAESKALFKSFEIKYNSMSRPHLYVVDNNGLSICIKYYRDNIAEKFQCLFAVYSELRVEEYNSKILTIQENNNGEIIAIKSNKP